jgi:hypothetical protein
MCAVWLAMTTPTISFDKAYIMVLMQWYGIYGIASVISFLLRRENQAVLATLVGFMPTTFAGYGPSFKDARNANFAWILDLSYSRWAVEMLYSEELTPFRNIYNVDDTSAPNLGYTLDRVSFDIFMMFLIGTVIRVICYFVMIFYNRKKQI